MQYIRKILKFSPKKDCHEIYFGRTDLVTRWIHRITLKLPSPEIYFEIYFEYIFLKYILKYILVGLIW